VALLVIVVGGTGVMVWVTGAFMPDSLPGWGDLWRGLTHPDNGAVFAGLLVVVGWAAWLCLMVCVLVYLSSRLRRRAAPKARGLKTGMAFTERLAAASFMPSGAFGGGAAPTTSGDMDGPPAEPTPAPKQPASPPDASASLSPEVASATPEAGPTRAGGPTVPVGRPSSPLVADEISRTGSAVSAFAGELPMEVWDHLPPPVRTSLGVGVAAASFFGLMLARRRARSRLKAPVGATMPKPAGDDAAQEMAARQVEDRGMVRAANRALRLLIGGVPSGLPHVKLARLGRPLVRDSEFPETGPAQLEILLKEAATLPAPWKSTPSPGYWICRLDAPELDDDPDDDLPEEVRPFAEDPVNAHVTTPYPTLVCVGHDSDRMSLLVDLEATGVLGVSGPDELVAQAQAALAFELAMNREWVDDIQVVTAGSLCGLDDVLRTGCLVYTPTLDAEMAQLERDAGACREILAAAGAGSALAARFAGEAEEAWFPTVLVLPGTLTVGQREWLRRMVETEPRTAFAAVASDPDAWGECWIELTGPDTAVLHPWGLPFTPQRMPDEVLDSWCRLLDRTDWPGPDAPADPGDDWAMWEAEAETDRPPDTDGDGVEETPGGRD
jgi:hypothetical protein